jgi:hypothetical protein
MYLNETEDGSLPDSAEAGPKTEVRPKWDTELRGVLTEFHRDSSRKEFGKKFQGSLALD